MSNILFLYPEDETLSFLNPAIEFLGSIFETIKIEANTESHSNAIEKIRRLKEDSIIIFFGHGASHCLYGAKSLDYERSSFLTSANISVFENKKLFALSCRSSDFLNSNNKTFKAFIGFGNMPTDWEDIVSERDLGDSGYLSGIDEAAIEEYKEALCKIILFCFSEQELIENFDTLYKKMKLSINQEISNLIINKGKANYRLLAKLWYDTKVDIGLKV